jgi:hypothetical protein
VKEHLKDTLSNQMGSTNGEKMELLKVISLVRNSVSLLEKTLDLDVVEWFVISLG